MVRSVQVLPLYCISIPFILFFYVVFFTSRSLFLFSHCIAYVGRTVVFRFCSRTFLAVPFILVAHLVVVTSVLPSCTFSPSCSTTVAHCVSRICDV
jgi:hypothetical protein